MKNTIFLRRKGKIVIDTKDSKNSRQLLATCLKNIEPLGYTFSKEILNILKTYSPTQLETFYSRIVKNLKTMLGDVQHKPMYPNFPQQVMDMDEVELYINAIIHYITIELPEYEKDPRKKLQDKLKLKVISLGTNQEFMDTFKNLINSKVAVSETDKQDIEWFVKQYRQNIINFLPTEISNKENLCYFIGVLKKNDLITDEILQRYFRTATDVLRYITALSDGDVSLKEKVKFINFKRSDRRLFLRILDNLNYDLAIENMLKYKNRWIRLGEILHPGEYHNKYHKAYTAFSILRNNQKIETFNSKVEKYFKESNFSLLLPLLAQRPGEFARKLDWLLRSSESVSLLALANFALIAHKVSNTILLQLITHFKTRNKTPYRVFIPKGQVAKIQLIDNNLLEIKDVYCKTVVTTCREALKKKFSEQKFLGKVYVDEALKTYTVPFALRSASKSLRTVTKGSRIKMDAGEVIRLFVHWKNIAKGKVSGWDDEKRVDVDLSAVVYSEDWEYLSHVSWTNLKSEKFNACHSGDITDAPKGASEFIDINRKSFIDCKGRYLVMNVYSYTGQKFSEIPECFAGCMIRQKPKSGEIYEPKTVKDKFDLSVEATTSVPLIFDLVENEIIWCDMAIGGAQRYDMIETKQTGIVAVGKALTNLPKPNLYELFTLHAQARGKIVKSKKQADVVFSIDEGITPFDIEEITSKYL